MPIDKMDSYRVANQLIRRYRDKPRSLSKRLVVTGTERRVGSRRTFVGADGPIAPALC